MIFAGELGVLKAAIRYQPHRKRERIRAVRRPSGNEGRYDIRKEMTSMQESVHVVIDFMPLRWRRSFEPDRKSSSERVVSVYRHYETAYSFGYSFLLSRDSLLVERRTRDRKVASSSPGKSGGRFYILFFFIQG